MKLLIISQFGGIGGAERSLIPLAKELQSDGYELTLLLLKLPTDSHIFQDFPGRVLFPKNASSWYRNHTLSQLNREIANTDLVIATSELSPTYISWLLSRWHRKPFIADVQVHLSQWINDSAKSLHHYLCRLIYPQISYIRCVSEGVSDDLRLNYSVPPKHLSIISVPFELDAIIQASQSPLPSEHHHIFNKPTIVSIGRFTSQKRFDIAIEALLYLRQSYDIEGNLLILGDGELRPQLEQQIRMLELSNSVFMPGFVENPLMYIARSQVFLLSSDYEGFGRVIVEALALGCPVVSTNCPSGPSEILEGGKYGLLVPTAHPQEMAHAIAQILTDSQLSQTFRSAGLQRAKDFSSQVIAQDYKRLINCVLS